ncbi:hypothetical protein H4R34_001576 [Dimargaris verticillata]|uniref:Muskelin N-terminal domain-containing protein n=1 Tax=Dimargaris verticillata TaxID=2761393 RepID=A0A9W8B9Q3_9FUNG|nr:hypothetical protein H4R34_001576 [Dimargaris verticillata]
MATIPPGPGTPRLAASQTSDYQPLPSQGLFPLPNYRITPPRVASETPVAPAVSTPRPPTGATARQESALEVLPYEIVDYSSYSSEFYPDYIKVNQPTTGKSRWSSAANNQRQYLSLKLDRPCLLQSITFGKFTRKHVCNLKEFRILAAATENQWVEVLHSGLRDDSEPETFTVRHTLRGAGLPMPVTWIKIIPLMTYDIKFNFSVWYVELRGVRDPAVIDPLVDQYRQYCQHMALRMCLKLLHDRNPTHFDAGALLGSGEAALLPSVLDDPLVTDLHASALAGQFDHLEALLEQCEAQHLFAEYIAQAPYMARWQLIQPNSPHRPCGRGGHQLALDETRGCLYLFGGWTGTKNLCDFWAYDVRHQTWTLLSDDVSR